MRSVAPSHSAGSAQPRSHAVTPAASVRSGNASSALRSGNAGVTKHSGQGGNGISSGSKATNHTAPANGHAGKPALQPGKGVSANNPASTSTNVGKHAGQSVNGAGSRSKPVAHAGNGKNSTVNSSTVHHSIPKASPQGNGKNAAGAHQANHHLKNNTAAATTSLAGTRSGTSSTSATGVNGGSRSTTNVSHHLSNQNWNNLHNNWNRHCANNYRHNWYRGSSFGFRPWFYPYFGFGLGYGGFGYGGLGYGGLGFGYGGYGGYGYGGYGGLGYGGYGFSPWGYNLLAYRWGYSSYYNPYCASYSYPYNYNQPVIIAYSATPSTVVEPSVATDVDAARDAFKAGDYTAAIDAADRAIKASPDDPVAHELRALALFALRRYDEAAAGLNSLLAVAPGWNWDTMRELYANADAYTRQLRNLEAFVRENPDNAAANFVLGYHYLVTNYTDAARKKLQRVVDLEPKDRVAAQLLKGLDDKAAPPATSADAAPTDAETDLSGAWTAKQGSARLQLTLGDDGTFTWIAPADKEERTITGKYTLAGNVLVLEAESGDTMVAKVTALAGDKFHFRFVGGPGDDPGLDFERAKTDVAKPPAPPAPPTPPEPAVSEEGGKDF
jgi:tetratricopeptide (TPR) repeat protein